MRLQEHLTLAERRLFNSRRALLNAANAIQIEFGAALEGINTVLFLVYVRGMILHNLVAYYFLRWLHTFICSNAEVTWAGTVFSFHWQKPSPASAVPDGVDRALSAPYRGALRVPSP